MAKSGTHCFTLLFPIYQNDNRTIKRKDDHTIIPSPHGIMLKIVGFYVIASKIFTVSVGQLVKSLVTVMGIANTVKLFS